MRWFELVLGIAFIFIGYFYVQHQIRGNKAQRRAEEAAEAAGLEPPKRRRKRLA
jgi:hypothetical protein